MTHSNACLTAATAGAALLLIVASAHGARRTAAPAAPAAPMLQPVAPPPAFATCNACHSAAKGRPNGMGPNLFGVVGAAAGTRPGYAYSPAMKASNIRWVRAKLDAFLADPKGVVPGTKMMIPGIKDAAKRSDIISYLETLK
jgi:cytochrome c